MPEENSPPPPDDALPATERAQLRLAQLRLGDDGDPRTPLTRGAAEVARLLDIGRLGIWLYVDGETAIRSVLIVQPAAGEVFAGARLLRRDFPSYFAALEARRVVGADDARTSALTAELSTAYLEPLGIGAMLDAPIYRDGHVVGVACLEHLGGPRAWTDSERAVAVALAQSYARLADEAERHDAESRVEVARGQLERVERLAALSRLAAGVAHDFRNVLHAVGALAQEIEAECPSNSTTHELAGDIRRAVRRGEGLVHDLLTFGQEGRAQPVMLDITSALRRMERLLTLSAGAQVTVAMELQDRIGRVLIDPRDFERMLVNLVLNARDAMPDGGRLTVRAHEAVHDAPGLTGNTWVVVEVQDTGAGIDPTVAARLFEPFFTTKGERGTGLGLPIVDQLVRAAGGAITVESEPGRGATFRLLLPRLAPPA